MTLLRGLWQGVQVIAATIGVILGVIILLNGVSDVLLGLATWVFNLACTFSPRWVAFILAAVCLIILVETTVRGLGSILRFIGYSK